MNVLDQLKGLITDPVVLLGVLRLVMDLAVNKNLSEDDRLLIQVEILKLESGL